MPKFHVQRSIQIEAPPEQVFDRLADYSQWRTWSPWLCAEPDADVQVTDDPSSVGSVYQWRGELVGQGEIEHVKLDPGRLIQDEIRFIKPFKSRSDVRFELDDVDGGTRVTWHMQGSLPWFLFWLKSQMDIFIGMDYERGLKMIKEWIETGEVKSKTLTRGVESVGPLRMAGVSGSALMNEIGPSLQAAMSTAREKLESQGIQIEDAGISVYHHFDMKAQRLDFTAGYQIPADAELDGELSTWSIPETSALCVEHIGSYDNLGNGWSAAHQFTRYKKLKQSRVGTFELYKNHPQETAAADLITEIYLPLK